MQINSKWVIVFSIAMIIVVSNYAQIAKAPERNEGEGQYSQLIIRGVTLINGTGAPAFGPVDIVIEKNKIVQIASLGSPGIKIEEGRRKAHKEKADVVRRHRRYRSKKLYKISI